MNYKHQFEVEGKSFTLETGRLAKQANGSVMLTCEETVILATATMSKEPREGIDFLPLVCDYEERKYSIGQIPGGFAKRGGRPSEKAILTSRLIDRPLRPLFPKGLRNEVQVIAMPFAVDPRALPDALSICAVGAALDISDIPFQGPVAGVRIGRVENKFIAFPTTEQMKDSDLDLIVAGHKDAISMVESGANELSEEVLLEALDFAHKVIREICHHLEKFTLEVGKKKSSPTLFTTSPEIIKNILIQNQDEIDVSLTNPDKVSRETALSDLTKDILSKYQSEIQDDADLKRTYLEAIDTAIKKRLRAMVLEQEKRVDGRSLTCIRKLDASTDILPKVHGSGLFTRGQTQVLTLCTLGMPSDAQKVDGLHEEDSKRYMHYYNFPPYSVGEARPLRGPGRREIGHGALAERALMPVLPLDQDDFPYTIQLTSEVLECNGSSSMASVCGSTLALMDAGVPIKAPVAGIAMGLMSDGTTFKVLTDIQGMEDFSGDMDFKVAGTRKGITALQLDTKLKGIPSEVFAKALHQAKEARFSILDVIEKEIDSPRKELSSRAPRMIITYINPDKIGSIIGPGGATIRKIVAETGAQIDVEQDGKILIGSSDAESAQKAQEAILALTATAKLGEKYSGKVTRIIGKGAMVEFLPGKEGMVPSESIVQNRSEKIEQYIQTGQQIDVIVDKIDNMGRVNLKLHNSDSPESKPPQNKKYKEVKKHSNGSREHQNRPKKRFNHDKPQNQQESTPTEKSVKNPESNDNLDFGTEIHAIFRPRR